MSSQEKGVNSNKMIKMAMQLAGRDSSKNGIDQNQVLCNS